MRSARRAVVLATVLVGCQALTEVQPMELDGLWVASQARFVEIAAPKRNNIDIIELGYEVTMDFDADGNFDLQIVAPDGTTAGGTGRIAIDGTDITFLSGTGGGEVFLEGEQMAIRLTTGLTFNFGDGRDVPARLLLVMDRVIK